MEIFDEYNNPEIFVDPEIPDKQEENDCEESFPATSLKKTPENIERQTVKELLKRRKILDCAKTNFVYDDSAMIFHRIDSKCVDDIKTENLKYEKADPSIGYKRTPCSVCCSDMYSEYLFEKTEAKNSNWKEMSDEEYESQKNNRKSQIEKFNSRFEKTEKIKATKPEPSKTKDTQKTEQLPEKYPETVLESFEGLEDFVEVIKKTDPEIFRNQLIRLCEKTGIECEIYAKYAYLHTTVGTWRFDYNQRPFVLEHQNRGGKLRGYHKQDKKFYILLFMIDYILRHDAFLESKFLEEIGKSIGKKF